MNTDIVSHYGIHWDANNIAFLMQGRGGTNAVGLKEKAPFIVRLSSKQRHCNHQIPLATPVPNDHHWNFFRQLLNDPLVRAMLPIPKETGGAFFIEDRGEQLVMVLVMLSKMSSPIYPVVVPAWTMTKEAVIYVLQETNVQPLVLTEVEAKHSDILAQVAKSAVYLPRKIVFVGQADVVVPQTVKRIRTSLLSEQYNLSDLMALPWESLGAVVVRKYMRGEWTTDIGGADDIPEAKSPRRQP